MKNIPKGDRIAAVILFIIGLVGMAFLIKTKFHQIQHPSDLLLAFVIYDFWFIPCIMFIILSPGLFFDWNDLHNIDEMAARKGEKS